MYLNIRYYSGETLLHEVNPYDSEAGTLKGLSDYIYDDPDCGDPCVYLPAPADLGPDESYVDQLVYEMHGGSTLTGEDESFHFALGTHRYKDNRIPPKGFRVDEADERLSEPVWDGSPAPAYFTAAEYAGGYDQVNLVDYGVSIPGAERVEIRLYYQTTSREYVEFLRNEINGSGALTLSGTGAGGDPPYIVQSDPFFSQLKAWGDTIWQLWEHNKDLPGGAPIEMDSLVQNVPDGNHAPVAFDDGYATTEDTTLTVPVAEGVLANDDDLDEDELTAVKESNPANGTLSLADDGSFAYTPTLNFNGVVTFTYHAYDGEVGSNTAVVTITVTAENDAPTAVDDEASTDEATATDISVLANDGDVEDETVSVDSFTQPISGTTSLNPDGTITFDPSGAFEALALGKSTEVAFTYTISDSGGLTATAQVRVSVHGLNDPPVAVGDTYTTTKNATLSILAPGVLGNDGDVDGDLLTAVLVSNPLSGTLSLAGDGSFVYTPTLNFNGVDSFAYKANDNETDSNAAGVTLMVLSSNEAPVAADDAFATQEDQPLVAATPGVLANDDDPNGNQLTSVLEEGPATGSLALNLDGSFVYTPSLNASGTVTFTYRANDGLLDSNAAVVTITVAAVNDPPLAASDSYSTTEGMTLSVPALAGVLANDSDVENDSLTAILASDPMSGTLSLQPDGSFVYTPTAGFSGTDSFTYQADDGQALSAPATVTLIVIARPPTYLYLPSICQD